MFSTNTGYGWNLKGIKEWARALVLPVLLTIKLVVFYAYGFLKGWWRYGGSRCPVMELHFNCVSKWNKATKNMHVTLVFTDNQMLYVVAVAQVSPLTCLLQALAVLVKGNLKARNINQPGVMIHDSDQLQPR
jgi:hypothetical protein